MSQDSSNDARLPLETLRRFSASLVELSSARDVDATLQLMVDLATELVPGVDYADVMFVRGGSITVPVVSHPLAREVDEAQMASGEGPCLSALDGEDDVVVVPDLELDDRWPTFTPTALELGIRSVSAHRLFSDDAEGQDRFGVLNLFGTGTGIDDVGLELRNLFASHCSVAIGSAIADEGLQNALRSRDIIGQAKGILMERHRLTPDEAYAMLRQASMDRNIKVRDLAETVTTTGALP